MLWNSLGLPGRKCARGETKKGPLDMSEKLLEGDFLGLDEGKVTWVSRRTLTKVQVSNCLKEKN